MTTKPTLGTWTPAGARVPLDLERLVTTRLLVQANSGQGKSWALRRIFEQLAGRVQQLIIDPEGEFATLREKHDFIICAHQGGDVAAHPRIAGLLARRLLETEASAVLDISELKARERHSFVRQFLESLIEAPKELRHPVLVAVDEAQVYAPEKGESEAAAAVIDVATRGRKRGLCLLAATQRISMFNKDAAAELKNRLIGGTTQDLDVKRAAFDLGLAPQEARDLLRALKPGQFYAYGPAFHELEPRVLITGEVETTHPEAGTKLRAIPPKPTAAIVALLPKLADLPKEAEEQARTIEDFKRELAQARRELTLAKKTQPTAPAPQKDTGRLRQLDADLREASAQNKRLRGAIEALMKFIVKINAMGFATEAGVDPDQLKKAIDQAVAQGMKLVDQKVKERDQQLSMLQREAGRLIAGIQKLLEAEKEPLQVSVNVKHQEPYAVQVKAPSPAAPPRNYGGNGKLADGVSAPQQKLLDSLAWLESKGVYPARKETLAAIAGVSPSSGGYFNNLGALRNQLHFIEYPTPGEVGFTDEGRAAARLVDDSRPVHEHWYDVVSGSERKILEALVEKHPEVLEKDALAEIIGVSPTSGGYFNNLGHLRTLGAIDYPKKGSVALTRHVMPE